MRQIRVSLCVPDLVSLTGLGSYLETCSEVVVLPEDERLDADVIVFVANRISPYVMAELRHLASSFGKPIVMVVNEISDAQLLAAVECRVVGILPRAGATGGRLLHGVLAAASGGGVMPPRQIGDLLKHLEVLKRQMALEALPAAGLKAREVEILRLMAEGRDTAEVAAKLALSERSVKYVMRGVTRRLNLRNRPHAVAYAVRSGVI